MGDAIREQSDDDQYPREELLMEYQEEKRLDIQDIQLEAGIPQETANKNLCKHTQDSQAFLVTPTKVMAYIHGTATKITVCIENYPHPLIIGSVVFHTFLPVSRNFLKIKSLKIKITMNNSGNQHSKDMIKKSHTPRNNLNSREKWKNLALIIEITNISLQSNEK
ncbi:hypothetical protein O181_107974 [Austropuccinia psidii MF-1]|uniref:Uncharacterized protein n=1 Tax=Austropuccinia psidii MF-1 TaxID=1389203 RepID=A0A9Q3JU28_9BASI|nr:hypothetical protein [Austropuccinia psidii MF-1]